MSDIFDHMLDAYTQDENGEYGDSGYGRLPTRYGKFTAYVMYQTDRAILVEHMDGRKIWLPKSQITSMEKTKCPWVYHITAPVWLLDKNLMNYEVVK